MQMVRYFVIALLGIGLVTMSTGGASADETKTGVATGRAIPCEGPLNVPIARLSVYRGDALVHRSSLPAGSTFHFALQPGTYTISNSGRPEGSKSFRIQSGRTTRVVLVNFCF